MWQKRLTGFFGSFSKGWVKVLERWAVKLRVRFWFVDVGNEDIYWKRVKISLNGGDCYSLVKKRAGHLENVAMFACIHCVYLTWLVLSYRKRSHEISAGLYDGILHGYRQGESLDLYSIFGECRLRTYTSQCIVLHQRRRKLCDDPCWSYVTRNESL